MHSMKLIAVLTAGIGFAVFCGSGKASAHEGHHHEKAADEAAHKGEVCPVSGDKIKQAGKYTYKYKGTVYNFCCVDCLAAFKKNPEKYVRAKRTPDK